MSPDHSKIGANLAGYASPRTFTARDYALREPEGCGVFGVYNHPEAARIASLGLHALQHRGQESAGVAVTEGATIRLHKGEGLVSKVFKPEIIAELPGTSAIGHVRYSTTGSSVSGNAQPLMANHRGSKIAVAHNGNLTNATELAESLEANGAIFQSTTDSELLLHLIAQNNAPSFSDALGDSLRRLHGAWSTLLLRRNELWAFRDSRGFRPLCLGKLDDGWVISSESCGLDIVGATYLREVKPGERLVFRDGKIDTDMPLPPAPQRFCVFELVYYSRPDSRIENQSVYEYRLHLGAELAKEHPADVDVVISVPDSSTPAAIGYARELGVPYENGLIRSHYIGRTFIAPDQNKRKQGAKLKYNPIREVLAGKRVAVIDDSIVRGTTSKQIVKMLRNVGAREVHMRISAPPWKYPCYYGIDTPEEDKLLASNRSVEQMRDHLGTDSLGFISVGGLIKSMPLTMDYCKACFNGRYPDRRPNRPSKYVLER